MIEWSLFFVSKNNGRLFAWHTFEVRKTAQSLENTRQISRKKLEYAAGNARNERVQRVQQHIVSEHNQLTHIQICNRLNGT